MMSNRFATIVVLLALSSFLGVEKARTEDFNATPAEEELIALLDSIDEQYETYWLGNSPAIWKITRTRSPSSAISTTRPTNVCQSYSRSKSSIAERLSD